MDRDLYITVYTMDGVALSHINPKMVGKNMMDLRDPTGKYHIKERMEMAAVKDVEGSIGVMVSVAPLLAACSN